MTRKISQWIIQHNCDTKDIIRIKEQIEKFLKYKNTLHCKVEKICGTVNFVKRISTAKIQCTIIDRLQLEVTKLGMLNDNRKFWLCRPNLFAFSFVNTAIDYHFLRCGCQSLYGLGQVTAVDTSMDTPCHFHMQRCRTENTADITSLLNTSIIHELQMTGTVTSRF